jgi:hypothetical protein
MKRSALKRIAIIAAIWIISVAIGLATGFGLGVRHTTGLGHQGFRNCGQCHDDGDGNRIGWAIY